MDDKLTELQKLSSSLEPSPEQFRQMESQSGDYISRFLETLPKQPAYTRFDKSVDRLITEPIGEKPGNFHQLLNQIENDVIPPGLNPASGGHMGYIPGGGLPVSALADYIAAATNPYAGVYYSSPGAVNLEKRLISWMGELLGYPKTSGGYLSSGGSLANLTAIVTARESHNIRPSEIERTVVYLTSQTHHCVDRALNVAGLKDAIRRYIPMDDRFRIQTKQLQKQITDDKKAGLKPWLIVASAGTTDAGAVDPLDKIADIAESESLWFHVDAAYGGFFLLTDQGKKIMKGIERSDSAVLDPHKGLFIPYGLGALVVRDESKLADAHSYHADYMQDTKEQISVQSPADLSPELSKHFRALRLWLPLKLHGVAAFRAALEEKLLLAKYAWQKLNDMDDFDTGPEPQLSVFMFRYNPKDGDTDQFNKELHTAVTDDGRVFFSTTKYKGNFVLRLAILSFRTHKETIDLTLKIIKDKASEIIKA